MTFAWANLAKADLLALRRYSVERWAPEVAQLYLEDVRAAAKRTGADPLCAKALQGSFSILRVRSHMLIVHLDTSSNHVTISRVLHVATDIERHLP